MKVLMVCLGNICRSPMAQGVMEHLIGEHGLEWYIDSAGTSTWHIGEQPDRRAISTCQQNGIDITGQRARQIKLDDFDAFDLILTMDDSNLHDVLDLISTDSHRSKVYGILNYAGVRGTEVPDPYFDGKFQDVFDLLWATCSSIIDSHKNGDL